MALVRGPVLSCTGSWALGRGFISKPGRGPVQGPWLRPSRSLLRTSVRPLAQGRMGFCTGSCQQLHGSEATTKPLALPKRAETTGPAAVQGVGRAVFKMRLALAAVVFEDSASRPPSSAGSVIHICVPSREARRKTEVFAMDELLSRARSQRPLRRQPRCRDPRGLTSHLCRRGAIVAMEEP